MDTERMKRVLERVYEPAAPAKEKKTPDALRESLQWEAEAAALLHYLVRTSRACQNLFGEPLRRCEARRRALHAEFFLREGERPPQSRPGTPPGVLSALRRIVLLSRARRRLYESAGENALPLAQEAARWSSIANGAARST